MRTRQSREERRSSETRPRSSKARRERQIVRILALLRMLVQEQAPTIRELSAQFGTRRETICRDLRALEDAGYPIAGDEQGRLSRPRLLSSQIPDIRFSPQELDALLFAAGQAQAALPASDSLAAAVFKLQALVESSPGAVPPSVAEKFDTWTCGAKDFRPHEPQIALLIEAILRKRRCRVTYRKPSRPEPKTYEFDPYRLLFVGGGLYVVGQVPKHTATATLSVDRLSSVSLLDTEFEIDPGFSPQKCREDAFGVSWQEPMSVVLRFRADQAPYVHERLWHPSQELTDLPEGAVQLAFRAGGPFEIRRWILGWGDAVEVVSPSELRKEMKEILNAAGGLYSP